MSKRRVGVRSRSGRDEPRKSEKTRQRILDAAAKVFAERGYGHTRLIDVAREANIHAGSIYYCFPAREALVEELLFVCTSRALRQMKDRMATLAPGSSTADQLLAAATAALEGIVDGDFYNVAFNRILPQAPAEVRARHRPVLREYFNVWRRIIVTGQARREIRRDIDAGVVRLTIAGSIQWAAEWASIGHGSAAALAEQMISIFMNGMLTAEGIANALRTPSA
jgi:AcrR family transcriptional regulator